MKIRLLACCNLDIDGSSKCPYKWAHSLDTGYRVAVAGRLPNNYGSQLAPLLTGLTSSNGAQTKKSYVNIYAAGTKIRPTCSSASPLALYLPSVMLGPLIQVWFWSRKQASENLYWLWISPPQIIGASLNLTPTAPRKQGCLYYVTHFFHQLDKTQLESCLGKFNQLSYFKPTM